MDVVAALIELKLNSKDNTELWKNELNQRKIEAVETLKAEGVYLESWFHVQLAERDYLMVYMRAKDIVQAQKIGRESQFPIDAVHRAFKQNWAKVIPANLLVDLVNDEGSEID